MQFIAQPDGTLDPARGPPMDEMFEVLRAAGFDAVQTDFSASLAPGDYADRLHRQGLVGAPGYFHAAFTDDQEPWPSDRFAAALDLSRHLELEDMVVACTVTPEGRERAARAQDRIPSLPRVKSIARNLERCGREALSSGVRISFHQHVGSAIESEAELRLLLEETDPDAVSLCLDTGHLVWAGCEDLAAFATDFATRISTLHVKDLDRAVLAEGRRQRWNYREFVRAGLWREPGDGDLGLEQLLAPWAQTGCWAVIEVDHPAKPTVADSFRACRAFIDRFSSNTSI